MKLESPLRYPGGKASLFKFLVDVVDLNDLRGCEYFEPYAGGAGAALRLLAAGAVSKIHLNDADRRISAFWQSVLDHTNSFVEKIESTQLTVDEWRKQKVISQSPARAKVLDLGFSTFYLNRCNRSGVLSAGPIGGYAQKGEWRMDVRFNREALIERVRSIGSMREAITISSNDALEFLKKKLPRGPARSKVLVYLDPPYVEQARRLYLNAYENRDHASVAAHMRKQKVLPWVMSYDDCALVRSLYVDDCLVSNIPVKYSLNKKRVSNELLIAPRHIVLPYQCRVNLLSTTILSAGAI
jgi:DNA adenine methylase